MFLRVVCGAAKNYPGGNANRYSIWGDVLQHYGIGTNFGVIADGHAANHLGPSTKDHMVADDRSKGNRETVVWFCCTQGHTLLDGDILANLFGPQDCAHGVRQKQSATYFYVVG
ncbi:MAG: hypothetical protein O9353_10605 [Bacteroidia bacterium]|nr:hypothetical protein [Bacteroidia bacterium]